MCSQTWLSHLSWLKQLSKNIPNWNFVLIYICIEQPLFMLPLPVCFTQGWLYVSYWTFFHHIYWRKGIQDKEIWISICTLYFFNIQVHYRHLNTFKHILLSRIWIKNSEVQMILCNINTMSLPNCNMYMCPSHFALYSKM